MTTDAKKALRKKIKSELSALTEDEISHQSHNAQREILNLPEYKNAGRISVYLSMPMREAQTDSIVHDALSTGKKVFVPYIHRPEAPEGGPMKRSIIEMLRLKSVPEYLSLKRDSWGIPSLPVDGLEDRENAKGGHGLEGGEGKEGQGGLDLIVVPGVAFGEDMSRLGHGAGFYDEYLTRYSASGERKRPFLVGLCLSEQHVYEEEGRIPTSEHDWRMDAVAVGATKLGSLETA